VLDDQSGTPKGIPMAPWVVDGLKAAGLALAAPGRGANGQSTVQPRSEACRVVVSQHCSVRMPDTIRRRMPCCVNQVSRPVPMSALCLVLKNTASGWMTSGSSVRT